MKYVALLSGGKDSCFNLLHCQKNGHELVAAVALQGMKICIQSEFFLVLIFSGSEELDSYTETRKGTL